MEYLSDSEEQTRKIARQFALKLKGGDIIALAGDLGSGKTFFVREILKTFGVKEKVQSPTFVLRKSYQKNNLKFEHFDLYRLDKADLETTGLGDVLGDSNTITFVEWSEKIKDQLPIGTIFVEFSHLGENRRKIKIIKKDET